MKVAQHTERIVELRDGWIVSDRSNPTALCNANESSSKDAVNLVRFDQSAAGSSVAAIWDRAGVALRMALLAMQARRLRTFLTMLGIIVGIASVASVVALGQGGQDHILSEIRGIGTNTVDIYPGRDWGDEKATNIRTLVPADATAIAEEGHVDSVSPIVTSTSTLRFGNVSVDATINGVGEDYFRVHDMRADEGRTFSALETKGLSQVVVLDINSRKALFPLGSNPIGGVIFLGIVPFRVIGVAEHGSSAYDTVEMLNVWVPYTAMLGRILGQSHLKSISARVSDAAPVDLVADAITTLLARRHGQKDFYVNNNDAIVKSVQSATATLSLVISSIALISLIVGGVGVMNIMLVSVTERTREIGVRAAVGARRSDILGQFLIEAVLICLIGGMLGVGLAFSVGFGVSYLENDFPLIFSTASILTSVAVAMIIGITFGFLPARNAARLDPITALARE
jgi:macrolide transport system ATP-binding/permease protein